MSIIKNKKLKPERKMGIKYECDRCGKGLYKATFLNKTIKFNINKDEYSKSFYDACFDEHVNNLLKNEQLFKERKND